MKISALKPGMTVYDVVKRKMGNTTMTTVAVLPVKIVSVDDDKGVVVASWNGNTEQKFRAAAISKWRKDKPVLVSVGALGMGKRLATREEIKRMQAEGKTVAEAK